MKFGKRLALEASRRWQAFYLDYKALKKAIRQDMDRKDEEGNAFQTLLKAELNKVSSFYHKRENELEELLHKLECCPPGDSQQRWLESYRTEVKALNKFKVLNYAAVVKAVKKHNRRFKDCWDRSATDNLFPLELLRQQTFFTSRKLAGLATQAEALAEKVRWQQGRAGAVPEAERPESPCSMLDNYQCPICLCTLHSPVVLSCSHHFCWACLVTHCTVSSSGRSAAEMPGDAADKPALAQAGDAMDCDPPAAEQQGCSAEAGPGSRKGELDEQILLRLVEAEPVEEAPPGGAAAQDAAAAGARTAECPVCRKELLASPGELQVDVHLQGFLEELQRQAGGGGCSGDCEAAAAASQRAASLEAEVAAAAAAEETEAEDSGIHRGTELDPGIDRDKPLAVVDTALAAAAFAAAAAADNAAATATRPAAAGEAGAGGAAAEASVSPAAEASRCLLKPQESRYRGKMTVVLDLDGTLITSFAPKQAPKLPSGMRTHLVGKDSKLNPRGIFVVERPGLSEFLQELSRFAEIVIFTAGLQDYAQPILQAVDPSGQIFQGRTIYRDGTTCTPFYPCIKDLSRLGRDLKRTLLVDDTPLAFLYQPDNGVPVMGFRGDPDDNLLMDAVLPLLQSLDSAGDVRSHLRKRFDMARWLAQHDYPVGGDAAPAADAAAPTDGRKDGEAQGVAEGVRAPAQVRRTCRGRAAAEQGPPAAARQGLGAWPAGAAAGSLARRVGASPSAPGALKHVHSRARGWSCKLASLASEIAAAATGSPRARARSRGRSASPPRGAGAAVRGGLRCRARPGSAPPSPSARQRRLQMRGAVAELLRGGSWCWPWQCCSRTHRGCAEPSPRPASAEPGKDPLLDGCH